MTMRVSSSGSCQLCSGRAASATGPTWGNAPAARAPDHRQALQCPPRHPVSRPHKIKVASDGDSKHLG